MKSCGKREKDGREKGRFILIRLWRLQLVQQLVFVGWDHCCCWCCWIFFYLPLLSSDLPPLPPKTKHFPQNLTFRPRRRVTTNTINTLDDGCLAFCCHRAWFLAFLYPDSFVHSRFMALRKMMAFLNSLHLISKRDYVGFV